MEYPDHTANQKLTYIMHDGFYIMLNKDADAAGILSKLCFLRNVATTKEFGDKVYFHTTQDLVHPHMCPRKYRLKMEKLEKMGYLWRKQSNYGGYYCINDDAIDAYLYDALGISNDGKVVNTTPKNKLSSRKCTELLDECADLFGLIRTNTPLMRTEVVSQSDKYAAYYIYNNILCIILYDEKVEQELVEGKVGFKAWQKIYRLLTNLTAASDLKPTFQSFSTRQIDRLVIYTVFHAVDTWAIRCHRFPKQGFSYAKTIMGKFRKLTMPDMTYDITDAIENHKDAFISGLNKDGLQKFENYFNSKRNKDKTDVLSLPKEIKNETDRTSCKKGNSKDIRAAETESFWEREQE